MREEFGGSAGLSVLSLRLVLGRNLVLLELASEISQVINFYSVSIVFILFFRFATLF